MESEAEIYQWGWLKKMAIFEALDLEIGEAAILVALTSFAVVFGWYLGTRISVSILNPTWLKKGFWNKYFPLPPSDNERKAIIEIIVSGMQIVIIVHLVAAILLPVFTFLIGAFSILASSAISLFDKISPGTVSLKLLTDPSPFIEYPLVLFLLSPIAMFIQMFLASMLSMYLFDLRYSRIARSARTEDKTFGAAPQ